MCSPFFASGVSEVELSLQPNKLAIEPDCLELGTKDGNETYPTLTSGMGQVLSQTVSEVTFRGAVFTKPGLVRTLVRAALPEP